MDKRTCIDILTQHNAWRRDDHVPNSFQMVNPTELGLAIDFAIQILSDYKRKGKSEKAKKADSDRKKNRYKADESFREECKERNRKYYREHREEIRAQKRDRYLKDDEFRHSKNKKDCEYYKKQKIKDGKQTLSV